MSDSNCREGQQRQPLNGPVCGVSNQIELPLHLGLLNEGRYRYAFDICLLILNPCICSRQATSPHLLERYPSYYNNSLARIRSCDVTENSIIAHTRQRKTPIPTALSIPCCLQKRAYTTRLHRELGRAHLQYLSADALVVFITTNPYIRHLFG